MITGPLSKDNCLSWQKIWMIGERSIIPEELILGKLQIILFHEIQTVLKGRSSTKGYL